MIQQLDEYGRAYTTDKSTAIAYRIRDRQINYHAIKNWYTPPIKYISFSTRDREGQRYRLPPSCGVGSKAGTTIDTPGELHLFGYQQDAVNFVKEQYDNNKKSCMIVSWTATGKSHIIMGIIYTIRHKTVIIVPNTLIGKWLQDKMWTLINAKFCIAAKYRKLEQKPDVLIVTGASFNNIYDELNWQYDTIICDEGHHLSSKRKDQMNMRKWDFICMLTATPERKEYWIDWFGMYLWEIHDTERQALPVKVLTYEYVFDYDAEQVIKAQDGLAPDSPEIYRRLYCANEDRIDHLKRILVYLRDHLWFKKMIVFTDRLEHIKLIQQHIPESIKLTGTEDKTQFLEYIKTQDEYTIIAMSQCAGEGFDLPELECWILFMSTSWNNTIDQTAGRIRRFHWDKQVAYYIDFIDIIRIMWWKRKRLGRYDRNRLYKNKWRDVEPLESLLSF